MTRVLLSLYLWLHAFAARTAKDLSRPLRHRSRRYLFLLNARCKALIRGPSSLNEKIRYKMAFDRSPMLPQTADKARVREFVRRRVGHSVLTNVFLEIRDVSDLDFVSIPERCVIKPTHGSGSVIVVDNSAPLGQRLPLPSSGRWHETGVVIQKSEIEESALRCIVQNWLKSTYSPVSEWCYWSIPKGVVVEELLGDPGILPSDFKFWCVSGEVRFVQADEVRFSNHRQSLYLPDWTPVDASLGFPAPPSPVVRPKNLSQMVEVAECLSFGFDFVRVDLYDLGDRVVFGELTHYPLAGEALMSPPSFFTDRFADWRPDTLYGPRALRGGISWGL